MLGDDMARGMLPDDLGLVGSLVRDVCYHNARRYFPFPGLCGAIRQSTSPSLKETLMTPSFDLTGSSAIVTGASTGLGRGMALALATAGADIVLVDHVSSDSTAAEIQKLGRKAQVLSVDLMQMSSIPLVVETAITAFGKVDILVNNAGIIRRTPGHRLQREGLGRRDDDQQQDRLLLAGARRGKGHDHANARKIINVASLLAFQGGIIVPWYPASKGAVAQVTKALANEWAALGITVNAIAPGYMATNNTKALREDPARSKS